MRYLIVVLMFLGFSCGRPIYNPSAPGFNLYDSDVKAVKIADEVMVAMGGRKAWDDTRHLSWSFFGRRHLIWDKKTGQVRIDSPRDSMIYLLNVHTLQGKVVKGGEEISHPDSLKIFLTKGKNIWINDSYWLVMPFKLKDSGVTLRYVKEDSLPSDVPADVLQLSFKEVGVTPQNKYEVWINQQDHLLKQWAFYAKADQEKPNWIRPWDNYQTYGSILLSADRSDGGGPANVKVFDSMDESVYQSFVPPDWIEL